MPIREATQEDVSALLPLFRAYTDFYECYPSDEGIEQMVRGVIAAPPDQAFILVATNDDGEIAGFAACNWKWSSLRGARIVFLDDLFVDPESRGTGLADALIEAIADVARAGGAPAVEWLTMPDNKRAHTVYDRVGGTAETLIEYELNL
jgi:GNAT superfamily N-acetyltransferase